MDQNNTTSETANSAGENNTPQSAYLPGFSAEQAESLAQFMANAVDNATSSMRTDITSLTNAMANLVARSQRIVTPPANVASQANMASQANLHPEANTPDFNTANFNPTFGLRQTFQSQMGPNPRNLSPGGTIQEPDFDNAPLRSGFAPNSHWRRWRPEELGTFDPDQDDVYTFTDRIREVANLRNPHTVQLNLSLQLRGRAKKWFELELSHEDKSILYSPTNEVNAWIEAIQTRFQSYDTLLLRKLHGIKYTRVDAAAKKDPMDYVHEVIELTRSRPIEESLMEAYLRFEAPLKSNLNAPTSYTTVPEFMEQVDSKKGAWYNSYSHFNKRLHDDQIPQANRPPFARSGPNRGPDPPFSKLSHSGHGNPEHPRSAAPRLGACTSRIPQVYLNDPEQSNDDSIAHAPRNVSQLHIPRYMSNTYVNNDESADDFGCTVIGCSHRYDDYLD